MTDTNTDRGGAVARGGQWSPHTGDDYAVVMLPGENTETASIHIYSDDEGLPQRVADALNTPQIDTDKLSRLNEFHRTECRSNHWSARVRDEGCDCGLTDAILAALSRQRQEGEGRE